MEIKIERYNEPMLSIELSTKINTEAEAVTFAKTQVASLEKFKNFKKVEIDGKNVSNLFEEFFKPCPCGNYGSETDFCWCSAETIYNWRKKHNLSEL